MLSITVLESPFGQLIAGVMDNRLCLLEFNAPDRLNAHYAALRRLTGCAIAVGEQPLHLILREQLEQYFAGKRQFFSLPLAYAGTQFQKKVWEAVLEIPYGKTRSYVEIAHQIGAPRAARAVGYANGRNRMAIVVPCHRVVNKDGSLAGYGGGLWRKQWLLELEQRFKAG